MGDRLEEALRKPVTKAMRESAADMADSLAMTYRTLADLATTSEIKAVWGMSAQLAEDSAKKVRAKGV